MVSLNWTNTSVLCLEDETMSKITKTILASSLALMVMPDLTRACAFSFRQANMNV